MQPPIDPKIDCVFKALFGTETNSNLLIHFLNAMLVEELATPIVQVTIINPYNEKEFISDKLSFVDVKARDQQDRMYQIEIQLLNKYYLPERILYNWTILYSKQISSGQNYTALCPAYSIWLLAENLLPITDQDTNYVHNFQLRDSQGQRLIAHGGIWLFELNKFAKQQITTEQERWLKFFRDAEEFSTELLPTWMNTTEMKQAMNTLKQFSEKEKAYYAYQARIEYIREQRAIQLEIEESKRNLAEEQKAREEERKAKEAALAEIARLNALLEKKATS